MPKWIVKACRRYANDRQGRYISSHVEDACKGGVGMIMTRSPRTTWLCWQDHTFDRLLRTTCLHAGVCTSHTRLETFGKDAEYNTDHNALPYVRFLYMSMRLRYTSQQRVV